jgi:uncharacterized protein (UPF0276 family)
MASRNTSSPLGVGVVWVPGIEPLLEPGMNLVDVVEIEPQMYWEYYAGTARPYRMQESVSPYLAKLGKPVIVHGVGGAAGGTLTPDAEFTRTFHDVVAELKPAWVSEHLSFLNVAGRDQRYFAGMMLPPLQTPAGVETAVRSLRAATKGLSVPFALETQVNYMQSRCGTLSDSEFLSKVVLKADCGILLDICNIWVNEKNGRQPVEEYLDSIPLDRVWEVHLAGAKLEDGVWLDAHNGTMLDEVLELTERILPRLPNVKALILEVIPYFVPRAGMELLGRQLELMRKLWDGRGSARANLRAPAVPASAFKALQGVEYITPALWEKTLGEWTAMGRGEGALFEHLRGDRGMETYRMIANSFRSGNLSDTMGLTVQFLLRFKGPDFVEKLLEDHCRWCPPGQFPMSEAKNFVAYLRAHPIAHPYLANILDFDEAKLLALEGNRPREIHFDYEPNQLLESIAKGELPENLTQGNYLVEVTP